MGSTGSDNPLREGGRGGEREGGREGEREGGENRQDIKKKYFYYRALQNEQ